MKEKIAVHCPTSDDWDRVQRKIQKESPNWTPKQWAQCGVVTCITPASKWDSQPGFAEKSYWKSEGYTIISAEDYLKGGEVEEFKVGAAVECVKQEDIQEAICEMCKDEYGCNGSHPDSMCEGRWCDEMLDSYLEDHPEIKLNEKENNMKDNGIDSNVLAVFGDKVNGNELVVIDRHFTEQMITRIVMEKHHTDIQAACEKAEAKRLKEEAKK